MTDANQCGTPADDADAIERELDAAWGKFEEDLAVYLTTMVDSTGADHLRIELPDPDPEGDAGCPPYAQFAGFGDGQMVHAEVSGNFYLLPQYRLGQNGCEFFSRMGWAGNNVAGDFEERNWVIERPISRVDEVASSVVRGLRFHFGIAHPHLLTYDAWGPAAESVAALGLCATNGIPIDEPAAPNKRAVIRGHESVLDRVVLKPVDWDDLQHLVESLLREKYENEPTIDDDGDFVLHHMGQPVWVCVRPDQPAVVIMARVAHDVHSRRATAVEISLLNRDSLWVHWTLRDRNVWQTLVLPGSPFAPGHMDAMLDLFFETMSATRDDLAFRTGAKVA